MSHQPPEAPSTPEQKTPSPSAMRPTPLGHVHYRSANGQWVKGAAAREVEPRRTPLGAVHISLRAEGDDAADSDGDVTSAEQGRRGSAGRVAVRWVLAVAALGGTIAAARAFL